MSKSNSPTPLERKRINRIASEYRAKGYDVIANPKSLDLPDFLKSFQPDLIARNNDEAVVIEVKSTPSLSAEKHLEDLAEIIKNKPGWRFELIITNPKHRGMRKSAAQLESMSEVEIRNTISDAKELLTSGFDDAAFLVAWSATEAALRILADEERATRKRDNTAYLLKVLTSLTLISQKDYKFLLASMDLRNSLSHGLKTKGIDKKSIVRLIDFVSEFLNR